MKRISALRLSYLFLASLPVVMFIGIIIGDDGVRWTMDAWMIIAGIFISIRPTFFLEVMREMSTKNGTKYEFKPMFSERFYYYSGIYGGIGLALIGLSDIIFKWR